VTLSIAATSSAMLLQIAIRETGADTSCFGRRLAAFLFWSDDADKVSPSISVRLRIFSGRS